MHTIAWIFVGLTLLARILWQEGIVFGFLFLASAVIGFLAFGFLKGLGYLALLFLCPVIFHLIERFLSMRTGAKLPRQDMETRDLRRD